MWFCQALEDLWSLLSTAEAKRAMAINENVRVYALFSLQL